MELLLANPRLASAFTVAVGVDVAVAVAGQARSTIRTNIDTMRWCRVFAEMKLCLSMMPRIFAASASLHRIIIPAGVI